MWLYEGNLWSVEWFDIFEKILICSLVLCSDWNVNRSHVCSPSKLWLLNLS